MGIKPLLIWVERLPEPEQIWDLHRLFSTTVHGYLHLGDINKILDSPEQVVAMEALLDTVKAAVAYRNLLPAGEHMALAPGSRSRELALAIDNMCNVVQVSSPEIPATSKIRRVQHY